MHFVLESLAAGSKSLVVIDERYGTLVLFIWFVCLSTLDMVWTGFFKPFVLQDDDAFILRGKNMAPDFWLSKGPGHRS